MKAARMISCMVNRKRVHLEISPAEITLDLLRKNLRLTGVKEGCREGDCGACTILLGERRDKGITYAAVNSCLLPADALNGTHVVTIEGLNRDGLNPIQEAFLEEGAVQCGFCTPGILLSLTAFLINAPDPGPESAARAISGNICRCTGYVAIRRAIDRLFSRIPDLSGKDRILALIKLRILPDYFSSISTELDRIASPPPPDRVDSDENPVYVAGGTDLFVHPTHDLKDQPLVFLSPPGDPDGIRVGESFLELPGGLTTEALKQAPEIRKFWPRLPEMLELVSSVQIRNRATIAGNIVNASPIGDIAILLLAMGAEIELMENEKKRRIPLRKFFLAYKKLAKTPAERLSRVFIPRPGPGMVFHFEKVSRRQHLDIASVNTAIGISAPDGTIREAHVSAGGVAPVPLFLEKTSLFLRDKSLEPAALKAALVVLDSEISPISDMRGAERYKRRLLRNLFLSHFLTLFPGHFERNPAFRELLSVTDSQCKKKHDSHRRKG